MTSALPQRPLPDAGGPAVGAELGGYRVGEVLREHGAALIHRAVHLALRREVALQVLRPLVVAGDPNARRAFRDGAVALAQIEHPRIVTVFDYGETDATAWIAFRLLDGPTLQDELAAGPLSARRALAVVEQVADALDAVHDAGLVHRDVRPDAIWVSGRHVVLGLPGVRRSDGATRLNHGALLGDVHTLAPEQLAGEPASPASDVFALAAVFVGCVLGGPAFGDGDATAVLQRRAEPDGGVPELELSGGRPADALAEWVGAALAADPQRRPVSAGAAAALLRAALETLPADARERPGALRRALPDAAVAEPPPAIPSDATRFDRRRSEVAAPKPAAGGTSPALTIAAGVAATCALAVAAFFGARALVQRPATPVVAVGSARFVLDPAWSLTPPGAPGPLAAALSRERVLRAAGATAEIGTLRARGPSADPLPAGALPGARRALVRIGRRPAVVYTAAGARIVVLQTATADAVVACTQAHAAACDALAAAVRLPGRDLVPGPDRRVAAALAPVLLRLHNLVITRQLTLRDAAPGALPEGRRDVQALYQRAVSDLSAARVAGPDAVMIARVLARLRAVVRAYDGPDGEGAAIGALRSELTGLGPLGYRVAEG